MRQPDSNKPINEINAWFVLKKENTNERSPQVACEYYSNLLHNTEINLKACY